MQNSVARTYNQTHVQRKYTPGRKRISIYVTWSYPGEAGRDLTELDNRFSSMTEVRRVLWPMYEAPQWSDPLQFQQGISGALELFFWGWVPFQEYVNELTGHPVPVFQRIDQAGFKLPIDERILSDVDTLFIFGLDHMITNQKIDISEIEALKEFIKKDGNCLVLGPHHDVGFLDDMNIREIEHIHHGDELVPRQQRFGLCTRSIMEGLEIPVINRWGLRPARDLNSKKIANLSIAKDLDSKGYLNGVTNFIYHQHLPHYEVLNNDSTVRVLAKQPIDLTHTHPFIEEGNTEFNMFLWMPPSGDRGGDILFADSTIFSTLFGVDESVKQFWKNLATI